MSEMKAPGWLRGLDIVLGFIAIALAVAVLAYPGLAILTLVFILSITLLILGIARLLIGAFAKYLPNGLRAINVGAGILALVLAIVAMLYPQLATQLLIYLISFALLIQGIARVVVGGFADVLPGWLRGVFVVVGLLTVVMSVAVFLFPAIGFLTLIFLVSIGFLLSGVARIISGITGIRRPDASKTREETSI